MAETQDHQTTDTEAKADLPSKTPEETIVLTELSETVNSEPADPEQKNTKTNADPSILKETEVAIEVDKTILPAEAINSVKDIEPAAGNAPASTSLETPVVTEGYGFQSSFTLDPINTTLFSADQDLAQFLKDDEADAHTSFFASSINHPAPIITYVQSMESNHGPHKGHDANSNNGHKDHDDHDHGNSNPPNDDDHDHDDDHNHEDTTPPHDDDHDHDDGHDHDHGTGGVQLPTDDPHKGDHAHGDNPGKAVEHQALLDLVPYAAVTNYTVKSGDWSDPSIWNNHEVPGAGAKVAILADHHVTYDVASDVSLFSVRIDGGLHFATDINTKMVVDTLVENSTGHFTIGTAEDPVQAGVKAEIVIADNGAINKSWDPTQLSRGVITHGAVEMHGQEKTVHLKVLETPMAGDTKLVLSEAPQGWQVGDKIALTGTHLVNRSNTLVTEDEDFIITSVEGNVIGLNKALVYNHDAPADDLGAYVANYSRNITISTENADTVDTQARGHVMFMHNDNIDVQYVEFYELGRTDKSIPIDDYVMVEGPKDIAGNSSLVRAVDDNGNYIKAAPADIDNQRGRYAVHLHKTGTVDDDAPAHLEGNAVWGSPGLGFVQHDSFAMLENNAAYNVFGSGFATETGNEIGAWTNNISIKNIGTSESINGDEYRAVNNQDIGSQGVGFWFQGKLVHVTDNISSGASYGSFIFYMRGVDQINIPVDNLEHPEIARYADTIRPSMVPYAEFSGNEAIASQQGVHIKRTENAIEQYHDQRNKLEDFTAWNVQTGAEIEYYSKVDLINFRLIGDKRFGDVGIDLYTLLEDGTVSFSEITGFKVGVQGNKEEKLPNIEYPDEGFYFLDVLLNGNGVDYQSRDINDLNKILQGIENIPDFHLITGDQVKNNQLHLELDETLLSVAKYSADPHQFSVVIKGIKHDSFGAIDYPFNNELYGFRVENITMALEKNGYYTLPTGEKVVVLDWLYSDRGSDNIEILKFATILADNWQLPNTAINHGEYHHDASIYIPEPIKEKFEDLIEDDHNHNDHDHGNSNPPNDDDHDHDDDHNHEDTTPPHDDDHGHDDGHDHDHGTGGVQLPTDDPHKGDHAHGDNPGKAVEHQALLDLVPYAAVTNYTVKSGDWSDPSIWNNHQVPGDGAKVAILADHHITYDVASDVSLFSVRIDGGLHFATDINTKMVVDTLVENSTGHFTIGTAEDPVQAGVKAEIVIADNGAINKSWDPTQLSRGVITHGAVEMHGQEKTVHLKVLETPMAGDTKLVLSEAPQGWQVGDKIVLAGTHYNLEMSHKSDIKSTQDEVLEIVAINGNKVTINKALEFNHDSPAEGLFTSVANYSRNITISTENADTVDIQARGHVMFMHNDNVDVQYVEFYELGRTDKSTPLDDYVLTEQVVNGEVHKSRAVDDNGNYIKAAPADIDNQRGRYAVHLHKTGTVNDDAPAHLEGNAVWGSPGWGYAQHDSFAVLENNAAYGVYGSAFATETGNEIGAWTNNISINAVGSTHDNGYYGVDKLGVTNHDFGSQGVGYWLTGNLIANTGNIVAGARVGFAYSTAGIDKIMVDTNNLPYPEIARYRETYDTSHLGGGFEFGENEVIASETGMFIVRKPPYTEHDVRTQFDGFEAWNVAQGLTTNYYSKLDLANFLIIGDSAFKSMYDSVGVTVANVFEDMSIRDSTIENFYAGIRHMEIEHAESKYLESINVVLSNVDIEKNTYEGMLHHGSLNFIERDITKIPDFIIVDPADIVPGRLYLDLDDSLLAYVDHTNPSNKPITITGTKTDTFGTMDYPFGNLDSFFLSKHDIAATVKANGYYTLADGSKATTFEWAFSDRGTGDVETMNIFMVLHKWSYIDPAAVNHGAYIHDPSIYIPEPLESVLGIKDIHAHGTNQDDVLYGTSGNDLLMGMDGNDVLKAKAGKDMLMGGNGNDKLYGQDGNDALQGNAGNDYLDGGNGNDTLIGGEGRDYLFGGEGADKFVLSPVTVNGEHDIIHDFNASEGDVIDLSNVLTTFDPLSNAVADYVSFTKQGAYNIMAIKTNPADDQFITIAQIHSVSEGALDIQTLINQGNLIV